MNKCKNCGSTNLYRNGEKLVCTYCGCKMDATKNDVVNQEKTVAPQKKKSDDGYVKGIAVGAVILTIIGILATVLFIVFAINLVKNVSNSVSYSLETFQTEESEEWYQVSGPSGARQVEVVQNVCPVVLDGDIRVYNGFGDEHKMVQGSIKNTSAKDLYNVTLFIYYFGDSEGMMMTTIDKIAAGDTNSIVMVARGNNVVIGKVVCSLENGQKYTLRN